VPDNDESLRKEVAETRNQLIKASNHVSLLASEIKELRQLVERQGRLLSRSSITAYAIFVGLLGGGFWIAYRTRLDRMEADRATLRSEREDAKGALVQARQELERRADADARAVELYELLQSRRNKEALERYPQVAKLPLGRLAGEVLGKSIARVRGEAALEAYLQGMESFDAGQWRRAAQEFRQSLQVAEETAWSANLRYHLGVALARLGQNSDAARALEEALRLGGDGVGDDASFHLATAYDNMRQRARAIAEYRKFTARFPGHRLASAARRRVAELSVR